MSEIKIKKFDENKKIREKGEGIVTKTMKNDQKKK